MKNIDVYATYNNLRNEYAIEIEIDSYVHECTIHIDSLEKDTKKIFTELNRIYSSTIKEYYNRTEHKTNFCFLKSFTSSEEAKQFILSFKDIDIPTYLLQNYPELLI